MSTYEPGTVAVATVRGVKGLRVVRIATAHVATAWLTPCETPDGYRWHSDFDVTDVRPLVVLDLAHPALTAAVLRQVGEYIRKQHKTSVEDDQIADFIADQIEAQTKPPRIPEPGLWGVVEADTGEKFLRADGGIWRSVDTGVGRMWEDVDNPTLVREGVTQ